MTHFFSASTLRTSTRKTVVMMMLLLCVSMAGVNIVSAFADDGEVARALVAPDVVAEIEKGNNDIIVTVESSEQKESVLSSVRHLSLVADDDFSQLPVVTVHNVAFSDVDAVASIPGVVAIEPVRTLSNDVVNYLTAINGFNVPSNAVNPTTLTGKGSIVGVIDSGINTNDDFFKNDDETSRIVSQACFGQDAPFAPCNTTPGKEAHIECESEVKSCWHGHAVSVLAVGAFTTLADDQGTVEVDVQGVAPEAGLSLARIASSEENGPTNISILAAFNKFLSDARTNPTIAPDVINISIGFDATVDPNCSLFPSLEVAVNSLTSAGITVVSSSGNEGNKSYVSSPACFENAIAVGATEYKVDTQGNISGEKVTQFTNTSSRLDVLAPGAGILGATPSPDYFFMDIQGTSFASPIVAGAVAVIKEADPALTPAEIRSLLIRTGDPIVDPATGTSYPRINLAKAVAALDDPAPPTTVTTTTTSTTAPSSTTVTTVPSSSTPTTSTPVNIVPTTPVTAVPNVPVSVAGVTVTNTAGGQTLPFTGSSTTGQLIFAAVWMLLAGVMLLCFKEGLGGLARQKGQVH